MNTQGKVEVSSLLWLFKKWQWSDILPDKCVVQLRF